MTLSFSNGKQRLAILAVVGFILLRLWVRLADTAEPTPLLLGMGVIAALALVWLLRSFRTARADELGVTRRGLFGTTFIPWQDVRQVRERQGWRSLDIRGASRRIRVPMQAPGYAGFHAAVHERYAERMGDGLRPKLPIRSRPPLYLWLVLCGLTPVFAWVGWQVSAGMPMEARLLSLLPGALLGIGLASLHPHTLEADEDGLSARWLLKRRRWAAEEIVRVHVGTLPGPGWGRRAAAVGMVVTFRAGRPLKLDQRWVTTGLGDLAYAMQRAWGLKADEAGEAPDGEPAPHAAIRP